MFHCTILFKCNYDRIIRVLCQRAVDIFFDLYSLVSADQSKREGESKKTNNFEVESPNENRVVGG